MNLLLGPLFSLASLILQAASELRRTRVSKNTRRLQRKLIRLQLLLEDIVDTAGTILSLARTRPGAFAPGKENESQLRELAGQQLHQVSALRDELQDGTSEVLLKLLAPELRRRVTDLIHVKGGFLERLSWCLSFGQGTIPDPRAWNHREFLRGGVSYIESLPCVETNVEDLQDDLETQEMVLRALRDCSTELAVMVKSLVGLQDLPQI